MYRGRNHLAHFYDLCGHTLDCVDSAKYLGVILSNDLSWSPHIQSVYNRANSTLGFLRRNLRRCPAALRETPYITLVLDWSSLKVFQQFFRCEKNASNIFGAEKNTSIIFGAEIFASNIFGVKSILANFSAPKKMLA